MYPTENMIWTRVSKDNCGFSEAAVKMLEEAESTIESLRAELDQCRDKNTQLNAGIAAVAALISNSSGVWGLHLNGDTADWDDLLEGGAYGEWLTDFSRCLEQETKA